MVDLVFQPVCNKDEMLCDYIERLSDGNGFKSVEGFINFLELRGKKINGRYYMYESVVKELRRRFGIEVKVKSFDLNSYFDFSFFGKSRICPLCFKENSYIRYYWRYQNYTTCHIHHIAMEIQRKGLSVKKISPCENLEQKNSIILSYNEICNFLSAYKNDKSIEDLHFKVLLYRKFKFFMYSFFVRTLIENRIEDKSGIVDEIQEFVSKKSFCEIKLKSMFEYIFHSLNKILNIEMKDFFNKLMTAFRSFMLRQYIRIQKRVKYNYSKEFFLSCWVKVYEMDNIELGKIIFDIPNIKLIKFNQNKIMSFTK